MFLFIYVKKKEWRRSNDAFQPQGTHCRCRHEDYVTDLLNFCTFFYGKLLGTKRGANPIKSVDIATCSRFLRPGRCTNGGLQSGEANVIGWTARGQIALALVSSWQGRCIPDSDTGEMRFQRRDVPTEDLCEPTRSQTPPAPHSENKFPKSY